MLFDHLPPQSASNLNDAPLAARMRPRSFDEFVGQEHVVGEGRVLRKSIEADVLGSIILWGPPGSGKTTLAEIIARVTRCSFQSLSAVTAGVADLRRVVEDARSLRRATGQRTILFIDEIHRFNKAQQDAILPHVERGVVTLIGATTENPSFEVNSALLSRCRVFVLRALTESEIDIIIGRALSDEERGLGRSNVELDEDARRHLTRMANGDARVALNALEMAASATAPDQHGRRRVTLAAIEDALQQRALLYDKGGEQHYDTISAFIKSLRGSDPDAALYWMARMLEAGEDPLFIVRRMVIFAAEDVGLADPQALVVAIAAQQAVHFVGMPEGYLPLAEAAIYLATAPKSNSGIMAYGRARDAVLAHGNLPVPLHLRNAPTGLMKSLGYHQGYEYSHSFDPDDPRRYRQRYLPDGIDGNFYRPSGNGFEADIRERMRRIEELRRRTYPASDPPADR